MSANALAKREVDLLAQHEATIERGLQTFYEVGTALLAIRDGRLYRQTHDTFEDYCRGRWRMTSRSANRLVAASGVVGNLGPIGPTHAEAAGDIPEAVLVLPATESQARPLAVLPPEQQREVWQEAVNTAPDGKMTAAHVAATVERARPAPAPPRKEPAKLPPVPQVPYRVRRVARDEALRQLNGTASLYLEYEYLAFRLLAERQQLPRDIVEAMQMVAAADEEARP